MSRYDKSMSRYVYTIFPITLLVGTLVGILGNFAFGLDIPMKFFLVVDWLYSRVGSLIVASLLKLDKLKAGNVWRYSPRWHLAMGISFLGFVLSMGLGNLDGGDIFIVKPVGVYWAFGLLFILVILGYVIERRARKIKND